MTARAAILAVLCLGLNACAVTTEGDLPTPGMPSANGGPAPSQAEAVPAGAAEAVGDVIVVRRAGAVSVVSRLDAGPLWSVPQKAGDPVAKARLARDSVVVVRAGGTAEVYDLRTGTLRFSKEAVGAVGVSWSTLYADSAACQPDCLLRAYDLQTGAQRWAGPKALPGNVMVELGEQPDRQDGPIGGPLRAPEAEAIAVRAAEGVLLLDAATGQELARTASTAFGMALGSVRTLIEWSEVKACKVEVTARDLRTGEITWRVETSGRLSGRVPVCDGGYWRPDISDGLITLAGEDLSGKAIEVDTGKPYWEPPAFGSPAVAVSRKAVITYGSGQLLALRPDNQNAAWSSRLWAVPVSGTARIGAVVIDFDRLLFTMEYEGSARGIGWVRDLTTGRRLWYGDGATPLGVDGDRVIVGTPGGEIKLEKMVSTG